MRKKRKGEMAFNKSDTAYSHCMSSFFTINNSINITLGDEDEIQAFYHCVISMLIYE